MDSSQVAPGLTAKAHAKKARHAPANKEQRAEIEELKGRVGDAVYQNRLEFLEIDPATINQHQAETLANYLRMNLPLKGA